jgi:hypothetical protein
MRNQHVTPGIGRHAWRALVTGAALALPVTMACADDIAPGKGNRIQNEVVKPSPHDGRLTAPHMSAVWWLRIRREAPQADQPDHSKQVFVRSDNQP